MHDVGAGLGERERGRGADAAPGGGDDGDTVVETEAIDQHAGTLPGRYVARMTVPIVDDTAHARAARRALRHAAATGAAGAPTTSSARSTSSPPSVGPPPGALVRTGVTVSLAHDFPVTPSPETPSPAHHHMLASGDARDSNGIPGYEASRDYIGTEVHGMGITHLDALCHMFVRGEMYNGRPAADVKSTGALTQHGDGHRRRPRRPGRVPRHPAGARASSSSTATPPITVADLERAEETQGSPVGSGDLLIVGGGRDAARRPRSTAASTRSATAWPACTRSACRGCTSARSRCSWATASPT